MKQWKFIWDENDDIRPDTDERRKINAWINERRNGQKENRKIKQTKDIEIFLKITKRLVRRKIN